MDGSVERGADVAARAPVHDLAAEIELLREARRAAEEQQRVAERARDLVLGELTAHERRLSQVVALCDLAQWAADAEGGGPPTVRVDDIRRALQAEEPTS